MPASALTTSSRSSIAPEQANAELSSASALQGSRDDARDALRLVSSALSPQQIDALSQSALPKEDLRQIVRHLEDIQGSDRLAPQARREMIDGIIRRITDVESTNQGMYCTCTVTTMQRLLVAGDPAEYVRLMRDLSVSGRAELAASGEFISLNPDSLNRDALAAKPPYQARDIDERVFQTALMEKALQGCRYDFKSDLATGHYHGNGPFDFQGLPKDLYEDVAQKLFNRGFGRVDVELGTDRGDLARRIGENASRTGGTMVEIHYDSGGAHALHEILVLNVDQSKGTVTFYNPHGATAERPGAVQQMSLFDFKQRLSSALLDDGSDRRSVSPVPGSTGGGTVVQLDEPRIVEGVVVRERIEFQMRPPEEPSADHPRIKVMPVEQREIRVSEARPALDFDPGSPRLDDRAALRAAAAAALRGEQQRVKARPIRSSDVDGE